MSRRGLLGGLLTGLGTGMVEQARARREEGIERAREFRRQGERQEDRSFNIQRDELRHERNLGRDEANFERSSGRLSRTITDQTGGVIGIRHSGEAFDTGIRASTPGPKPPRTREIKRGDQIVSEEWDSTTGAWSEIGTSPRYAEKSDSYASVLVPLAKKLAEGGELSPGEQRAADLLQRTDVLDRMIRDVSSGVQGPSSAPGESSSIINEARMALAQGADREAVRRRLRELGVDPAPAGL